MNPKLSTSIQWTHLPSEFLEQVHASLLKLWPAIPENLSLIVEGWVFPEELVVRIGFLEKGRLTQANFEISKEISKKQKIMDQVEICFDAAFTSANEYLTAGESANPHVYPRIWKELTHKGNPLWFQFSTENSELEKQANQLLGAENSLMNFDETSVFADLDNPDSDHLH